jgi:DNA-binding transcriptional regulator GbsR (MarR family)
MSPTPSHSLSAFQTETVALCVRAASVISMPRSFGEIYGLLLSTELPLSLDDIMDRLKMSRGSAFEGLRAMRDLGAVKPVYLPGVRKEHFTAETSLRKLATGFLRDRVQPHVENGLHHLDNLKASIDTSSPDRQFELNRLTQIQNWHKFLKKTLPIIKALAGKF